MLDSCLQKYIERLHQASQNDDLVVFIGSGFNKELTNKSLTWEELIKKIAKEIGLSEASECNNYLKIAQMYENEFGKAKLSHFLNKNIVNHADQLYDGNESPLNILFNEVNPFAIITTNWDDILINYAKANVILDWETIASDNELFTKKRNSKYILKMHGDIKNENFVFTENTYLNYHIDFKIMVNRIKDLLTSKTLLFIGYSFNDPDLKQIIKFFDNSDYLQLYYYASEFNSTLNIAQVHYLERFGFKVLTRTNLGISDSNSIKLFRMIVFSNDSIIDNIKNELEIFKNHTTLLYLDMYRIFRKKTVHINLSLYSQEIIIDCVDSEYFNSIVSEVQKYNDLCNSNNIKKEKNIINQYFDKFKFKYIKIKNFGLKLSKDRKNDIFTIYSNETMEFNDDFVIFTNELLDEVIKNNDAYMDTAKKQSDYSKLLIACKNNSIYKSISKYIFDTNKNIKPKYLYEYNLEGFYDSLSHKNKEENKNIYRLINNSEVLRLLYKVEDDIEKFDKNILHYGYLENYFGIIFNIISFANDNNYLIELNRSFATLIFKVLKLYILYNDEVHFDNYKIYLIIKCLDSKYIYKIIKIIHGKQKSNNNGDHKFSYTIDSEYALEKLNVIEKQLNYDNDNLSFFNEINTPIKLIEKIILFSSICTDKSFIENVIDIIIKLFDYPIAWHQFYDTIRYFFNSIDYSNNEQANKIIDLLIKKKIGEKKATFYEIDNIDKSILWDIVPKDFKYNNSNLLNDLMSYLNKNLEFFIKEHSYYFLRFFLYSLYIKADEIVKKQIEDFYNDLYQKLVIKICDSIFYLKSDYGLIDYNMYLFLCSILKKNKIRLDLLDEEMNIPLSSALSETYANLEVLKVDKKYLNIIKGRIEQFNSGFNGFFNQV